MGVHTCVKVSWGSEQEVPSYETRITYVVSHKIWVLNPKAYSLTWGARVLNKKGGILSFMLASP